MIVSRKFRVGERFVDRDCSIFPESMIASLWTYSIRNTDSAKMNNGFIADAYGKRYNSWVLGFDRLYRFEIIRRYGVVAIIDVDRNVISPVVSFKLFTQRGINCISGGADFCALFFGGNFFFLGLPFPRALLLILTVQMYPIFSRFRKRKNPESSLFGNPA